MRGGRQAAFAVSAWRAPEAEARRRRGLRVRVLRRDGLEEVEGVEEDGRRLAAAVEGGVEVRAVKYEAWGAVMVEEVEVEVVEEAEAAGSLTGGEADHRQHVVHAHLQPQLRVALQRHPLHGHLRGGNKRWE